MARSCFPLAAALALILLPCTASPPMAQDLSPMGMYRQADPVVQGVMIGLIAASVLTWSVLVAKLVELMTAFRNLRDTARQIGAAPRLTQALKLADGRGPGIRMLAATAREMNRSGAARADLSGRVASHLAQIQARATREASRGTGILATIGATAPFVGLFGTVWGIMNSFIGIAQAQTTNLAVVAPGIAEALLATALGLVAAIPAVVIYNFLARVIASYRLRLSELASEIERLVGRDLDRAALGV
ncbi:tonB-system energizer ExbB [Paracoccus sp. (in: a-proteobacteria)]|uniref:tonB-system energizer ExbB n=1 Tax=Paracoccus sp. TaxID=267 RepID=UPI003A876F57